MLNRSGSGPQIIGIANPKLDNFSPNAFLLNNNNGGSQGSN